MMLPLLMLLATSDPGSTDPAQWSVFPAPQSQAARASDAATLPPAAAAQYNQAATLIGQGRSPEATALLNQLGTQYPRVAEIFAARCSAQLAVKQPQYARADCEYALKLKPSLLTALFGLANAEEQLGLRTAAAQHYREYVEQPAALPELKARASARLSALGAVAAPTAAPVGPAPYAPPAAQAPSQVAQAQEPSAAVPPASSGCLTGDDGRQACGFNCMVGKDGKAACADMPEGRCSMNLEGHATCSQLVARGGSNAGGPPPSCLTGTDGRTVCGYHCAMGKNGRYYCANRPEGQCQANADGTYACQ